MIIRQGPLPTAEELQKYNTVFEGCAERLVALAENQSNHRQVIEKAVVNGNVAAEKRGQIFGFIIAMTAVIGGIYLIANDRSVEGLVAIIAALSALVGVFVYGRIQQKKERETKLNQNTALIDAATADRR